MSDATENAEEDPLRTPPNTTPPAEGPRHRRTGARLTRTRLAVLAAALLLLAGGGIWWAAASAGQRTTRGAAVPQAGIIADAATATPDPNTTAAAAPSAPTGATATPTSGPAAPAVRPTPPAPPPPVPTSWPTEAGTGASGSLAAVSGDVTLARAGQVYANVRLTGTLTVTACNVTIRNVEVDAGIPYTGNGTPDLFAIWLQEPASCGVTLDHVSVLTKSAPNVYLTTGVRDARGAPITMTNSKVLGAQLGVLGISSGVLRGNYIALGPNMRGDHNDAVQVDGSSGLTLEHNTLLNPNDQTSALALYTEYGPNTNDVVRDNLLAGGGYVCYCGDGKSDNNGNPTRAVNVSFVDNVFWRRYYSDAGNFGAGRAYNPAGGGQWTNNVYMAADGTPTTEQVPQPALDQ